MKICKIFNRISSYKFAPYILLSATVTCMILEKFIENIWVGRVSFVFLIWSLYSTNKVLKKEK